MSFEPLNEAISIEPFSDESAQGFTLSIEQVIRDGKLKLRGSPTVVPQPSLNWQRATWSQTSEFNAIPDSTQPGDVWSFNTTVPSLTSAQASGQFPFTEPILRARQFRYEEVERPSPLDTAKARRANRSRLLSVVEPGETELRATRTSRRRILGRRRNINFSRRVLDLSVSSASQESYIDQNTSDATSFWPDNVNNSVGFTIELRASVASGTSEFMYDDGAHRVTMQLAPEGIYESSELRLAVPWKDSYRKVRIAAIGDDLFMLGQDGQSWSGVDYLSGGGYPSVAKDLRIGLLGASIGQMKIDSVYQSHFGVFLDIEDDLSYNYDTSTHTAYTPSVKHANAVNGFVSAVIKSEGPYAGGTTKVQAQLRNTSNPSWVSAGSQITLTKSVNEIDLSGVSVDGDGSDELRFAIEQIASDTSARPAAVDQIAVQATFADPTMRVIPESGPIQGGNTVRLVGTGSVTMDAADGVYVGGIAVSPGDITHISTSEKSIVWPAGGSGAASVRLQTPDTSSHFTDRPYRYVTAYDKVSDRAGQIARVCGTRSAFRIKNEVPDGEVNLAYISSPGLEAGSHVGLFDLSYVESGNIVTGSAEASLLTGPNTSESDITFSYQNSPATEEVAIAVGAAGWRELGVPAPLYYYHIIGKGRYYIKKDGSSVTNEELRDSIVVHFQDGTPVSLEEFPWDIVVTTKDIHGNQLPSGHYLVALLTNKKFIPGETVFVTTTVADPSNEMRLIQGYSEVINTKPVFTPGTLANFTFSTNVSHEGEFTLSIRSR